jgi:hypothetical protein
MTQRTRTAIAQNPGTPVWAGAGAFTGRFVGGLPALIAGGMASTTSISEEGKEVVDVPDWAWPLRIVGQIAGAAGGAALGAPPHMRKRAAVGAAIGAPIPLLGVVLSPLGAWLATKPKSRKNNEGEVARNVAGSTIAWTVLGLAVAGGAAYAGVRWYQKKKKEKEPTQLTYDVRELPGLQIDMRVGDSMLVATGGQPWAVETEYPVDDVEGGWLFETSPEYMGTWHVRMDTAMPGGEPEVVEFSIKVRAA